MARLALKVKQKREPKFTTRKYNRCSRCGRARAFYRKFGLCRLCFRDLALDGKIPGVRKSSSVRQEAFASLIENCEGKFLQTFSKQ